MAGLRGVPPAAERARPLERPVVGAVWTTLDEGDPGTVRVFRESGGFRENDYDTNDYEEPFPAEGDSATEDPVAVEVT